MQIPFAIVAFEILRHESQVKSPTRNHDVWGTHNLTFYRSGELQQWYYLSVMEFQRTRTTCGPPVRLISLLMTWVLMGFFIATFPSFSIVYSQSNQITVTGYITDTLNGKNSANKSYRVYTSTVDAGNAKYALYDEKTKKLYILNPQNVGDAYRGYRMQVKGTLTSSPIQRAGEIVDPQTNQVKKIHQTYSDSTPVAGVLTIMSFSYLGDKENSGSKNEPWANKVWTQWTAGDCNLVLQSSPWSQSTSFSGVAAVSGNLAQLRSALPIRQALLRQLQLKEHYDNMAAGEKEAFDQAHLHDLDQSHQLVIYIMNSSFNPLPSGSLTNPGEVPDDVEGWVGGPRQAALRLSDGSLIQAAQMNPVNLTPGVVFDYVNQLEYVFPRMVNAKPLYLPSDLALRIELGAPVIWNKKTGQFKQRDFHPGAGRITFPILTLTYKGKLEY